MATPPYTLDEATPGDSDLVSQFPAEMRNHLDVIEDWINTEHSTYGHHKIPSGSEATRDATTSWVAGSLFYNTDTATLEVCTSADPDVWADVFAGTLAAPSGTKMLFRQTTAPTGWTKDTTYNNYAIRVVTGTISQNSAGSSFQTIFTDRTITQANLPAANLTHGLTLPNHIHSDTFTLPNHVHDNGTLTAASHSHGDSFSISGSQSGGLARNLSRSNSATTNNQGGQSVDYITWTDTTLSISGSVSSSGTLSTSGNTGNPTTNPAIDGAVGNPTTNPAITGTVQLGGSGTAMDFDVNYVDCIIATKD